MQLITVAHVSHGYLLMSGVKAPLNITVWFGQLILLSDHQQLYAPSSVLLSSPPIFHMFMHPLSDYTASCSFYHQGRDRNKDRDILSNSPRSAGMPPKAHQHAHCLHLPGKQTRTQSHTVDKIHKLAISRRDLATAPLWTEIYASTLIQGHAGALRCKEATYYSRETDM